jgi:quercetin dioxygenase-like cupin family protein
MRGMIKQLVVAALALGLTAPAAAVAQDAAASPHETVTPLASQPISNIPGKRLVSVMVDYPPRAASLPHRHAASAFIYAYVVSGEIRSAVDAEPARVYRAGEGWFEQPGAHHVVSENASETQPARLLAIFIVDEKDELLTTPDYR